MAQPSLGRWAVAGVVFGVGALAWYHSKRRQCAMKLGPFDRPVEDYAPSEPVRGCDIAPKLGPQLFRVWILKEFGGADGGIERACTPPATSTHHEGRAWDWFPPDRARADAVIACLLANDSELARRAGVRVIIYYERIWNAGRAAAGGDGWALYKHAGSQSDTLAHRDHVHFSFGWAGARAQTSLFAALARAAVQRRQQVARSSFNEHIAPRRTEVNFAELRAALERGHREQLGLEPSPHRLRMAWAMVSHETDQTRSMWNHNVGNIACTPGFPRCHALNVRDPTREPVFYRSYPDIVAGARDYWRLLSSRYPAALEAFDTGDSLASAVALKAKGYMGQAAAAYADGLDRHLAVYDSSLGRPGGAAPPSLLPVLLLVAGVGGAVAMSGGWS